MTYNEAYEDIAQSEKKALRLVKQQSTVKDRI